MRAELTPCVLDVPAWQAILDRHQELFEDADPRMRMALVARHWMGPTGTQRSVVQRVSEPVPMLAWHNDGARMCAKASVFRGLEGIDADVLFVANEGALEAVLAQASEHALGEMKRNIARGAIQLFILRSREQLRELGYEDFLEHLGLPFLGACR